MSERKSGRTRVPQWATQFSVTGLAEALALVIVNISRLPEVSWLVWFCVLAIDLLVFALAIVSASALAIIFLFQRNAELITSARLPAVREVEEGAS